MIFPAQSIYYISLRSAHARRMKMEKYLSEIDLRDANGNKPVLIYGNSGQIITHKVNDSARKTRLSKSEIGCYASHMMTWKEVVTSKANTALILEDDCRFDLNKIGAILRDWNRIPDFDFLNFCCHSYRRVPVEKRLINPTIGLVYGYGYWLTHCYMVSLSGAEKLLNLMAVQRNGLDHQLAEEAQRVIKTYAFANNPAYQVKFSSQINHTNP